MKGLDTPYSTVGKAHDIRNLGYGFVGRYISNNSHQFPNKCLTKAEAQGLHSVGIKILSVYETVPTQASYFSRAQGINDANNSLKIAKLTGQPQGSAIYFAIDFDATITQIEGQILEYTKGFHDTIKKAGYLTGCYGSGAALRILHNLGYIHYKWLAQSMGWLESRHYKDADIIQGPSTHVLGMDIDTDSTNSLNGGLW